MSSDRSGESQHNVWYDHNLGCSMAGTSEFETVSRNKFKHTRYYANSGYMQVLKRIKNAEETWWNYIFQMLKGS